MNFLKTSFWSALSTIIKIAAGLVTTKILAIYLGPAGLGLFGNFINISSILAVFSNGAIGVGTTKYIAEFEEEDSKQNITAHTIKITLICSLTIGLFVILFHKLLANVVFGDDSYSSAFVIFGITTIFFGLNASIIAIFNGYKQVNAIVMSGIVGSTISVLLSLVLTIRFGMMGALVNTSFSQVIIFLINVVLIRRSKTINFKLSRYKIKKITLWILIKFALMSVVSTLAAQGGSFIIRSYILDTFSSQDAGYIQGVWSISGAYLLVITTTLSIYYLPTLSGLNDSGDLRKEIMKGYRFLLPLTIIGGLLVFLSRDLIISILYTPDFLPMKAYFNFQIVGDTLKIASWILAYLMVAKAMTRLYIITEIIFSILNVVFSLYFVNVFGSIGVTYGYALNYLLYLVVMIYLFKHLLVVPQKVGMT